MQLSISIYYNITIAFLYHHEFVILSPPRDIMITAIEFIIKILYYVCLTTIVSLTKIVQLNIFKI